MAEVIVTRFDVARRRPPAHRLMAAPGEWRWLDHGVAMLPAVEWRSSIPGVLLKLVPYGRPVSWCWLAIGESAWLYGRAVSLRAAVFEGGRLPARLVFDVER